MDLMKRITVLHACEISTSLLSVIVGIIGQILFFRMDPKRRAIYRMELLYALIVADFWKAFFLFCYSASKLRELDRYHELRSAMSVCNGWGYLISVMTTCSDLFILALTAHNAVMIAMPSLTIVRKRRLIEFRKIGQRFVEFLHGKRGIGEVFKTPEDEFVVMMEGGIFTHRGFLECITISTALVTSALVYINGGSYTTDIICSAPHKPIWKRLVSDWVLKYVNIVSIVCVYSTISITVMFHLKKIERSKQNIYEHRSYSQPLGIYSDDSPGTTMDPQLAELANQLQKDILDIMDDAPIQKAAIKELRLLAVYPIGYLAIWIAPVVSEIRHYVLPNAQDPLGLEIVIALIIPLSCTVDVIIFLVREKPWNYIRSKMSNDNSINNGQLASQLPDTNSAEQQHIDKQRESSISSSNFTYTGRTLIPNTVPSPIPERDNDNDDSSESPMDGAPQHQNSAIQNSDRVDLVDFLKH